MAKTADTPTLTKTTEDEAQSPEQKLLEKVKQDYEGYYKYIDPYRKKWLDYWKLWNNERVDRQYEGDTDIFDPMTFQMVETIVDNVYGARPKLTFLPTKRDQENDTKILNSLWDASWDNADIDDILPSWGREITITGNGCWFPCMEDGLMVVKHFPIADCILDTKARRPNLMRFAGYRRLDSLENLRKEMRFDSQAGEKDENGDPKGMWVKKYSHLEDIPGTTTSGDQLDAQLKEQIYAGSTSAPGNKTDEIEVIYMHYIDKVVEIANRSRIIYEGKNYYQKPAYDIQVQARDEQGQLQFEEGTVPEGAEFMTEEELAGQLEPTMTTVTVPAIKPFIPVVMQREFVDPALLIAKGDVEPFAPTQESLNDALSVRADNIIYNVQNIGLIDSLAKSAIPDFVSATPGAIIPIAGLADNPDVFKWLEKPDFTGASENEINRAKKSIRDTARVGEVAQGIESQNSKDTTATEINATLAQATGGFATKIRGLESGAYKQLGTMFVKMVQIFLTEEQLVRIVGKDGVEFKEFDPQRYWGPYDVKVVLEQTAKAKQKEEAQRVTEVYTTLLGDPDFNQLELKKMFLRKALDMDDDDIELLLNPTAGNMAVDENGMPVGDVTAGSQTDTPPGAATPIAGVAPPAQAGAPAPARAPMPAAPVKPVFQPRAARPRPVVAK